MKGGGGWLVDGNAAIDRVYECGAPPAPHPPPPSAAAVPAKAKWDHNLTVSAVKTQPAECYHLTAVRAAGLSLAPSLPRSAAAGEWGVPSGRHKPAM